MKVPQKTGDVMNDLNSEGISRLTGDRLIQAGILALQKKSEDRTTNEVMTLIKLTTEIPFFKKQFGHNHLQMLSEFTEYFGYEKHLQHRKIFSQGDRGDKFYLLLRGRVKIIVAMKHFASRSNSQASEDSNPAGSQEASNEEGAAKINEHKTTVTEDVEIKQLSHCGDTFGELALIDDKPRGATIICMEDSDFITFDKQSFLTVLRDEETQKLRNEIAILNHNYLMADFSLNLLKGIYLLFSVHTFQRGEIVFREGDPSDKLYLIREGEFKVSKKLTYQIDEFKVNQLNSNERSNRVVHAELGIVTRLQFFGEEDFFCSNTCTVSVECNSNDAVVMVVKKKDLIRRMSYDTSNIRLMHSRAKRKQKYREQKIEQLYKRYKDDEEELEIQSCLKQQTQHRLRKASAQRHTLLDDSNSDSAVDDVSSQFPDPLRSPRNDNRGLFENDNAVSSSSPSLVSKNKAAQQQQSLQHQHSQPSKLMRAFTRQSSMKESQSMQLSAQQQRIIKNIIPPTDSICRWRQTSVSNGDITNSLFSFAKMSESSRPTSSRNSKWNIYSQLSFKKTMNNDITSNNDNIANNTNSMNSNISNPMESDRVIQNKANLSTSKSLKLNLKINSKLSMTANASESSKICNQNQEQLLMQPSIIPLTSFTDSKQQHVLESKNNPNLRDCLGKPKDDNTSSASQSTNNPALKEKAQRLIISELFTGSQADRTCSISLNNPQNKQNNTNSSSSSSSSCGISQLNKKPSQIGQNHQANSQTVFFRSASSKIYVDDSSPVSCNVQNKETEKAGGTGQTNEPYQERTKFSRNTNGDSQQRKPTSIFHAQHSHNSRTSKPPSLLQLRTTDHNDSMVSCTTPLASPKRGQSRQFISPESSPRGSATMTDRCKDFILNMNQSKIAQTAKSKALNKNPYMYADEISPTSKNISTNIGGEQEIGRLITEKILNNVKRMSSATNEHLLSQSSAMRLSQRNSMQRQQTNISLQQSKRESKISVGVGPSEVQITAGQQENLTGTSKASIEEDDSFDDFWQRECNSLGSDTSRSQNKSCDPIKEDHVINDSVCIIDDTTEEPFKQYGNTTSTRRPQTATLPNNSSSSVKGGSNNRNRRLLQHSQSQSSTCSITRSPFSSASTPKQSALRSFDLNCFQQKYNKSDQPLALLFGDSQKQIGYHNDIAARSNTLEKESNRQQQQQQRPSTSTHPKSVFKHVFKESPCSQVGNNVFHVYNCNERNDGRCQCRSSHIGMLPLKFRTEIILCNQQALKRNHFPSRKAVQSKNLQYYNTKPA